MNNQYVFSDDKYNEVLKIMRDRHGFTKKEILDNLNMGMNWKVLNNIFKKAMKENKIKLLSKKKRKVKIYQYIE